MERARKRKNVDTATRTGDDEIHDAEMEVPLINLVHGSRNAASRVDQGIPRAKEATFNVETAATSSQAVDIGVLLQTMTQVMQNQNQQQLQQQKLLQEQTQSSYFDKLYRANAPNFEGGPDPDVALNWIAQMETKFKALRFPEDVKVQVVIPFLVGNAENWWRSMEPMINVAENDITWKEFKEMFLDQYFPRALRKKRQNDFYSLRQTENMTVLQYANNFTSLGRFCPKVFEDEEEKMDRFEQGLREEIGCQLASHKFTTFKNMYDAALAVEMRFKLNEGERSIGKKPRWMMGSNQAVGTRQQGNFQNANKRRGPINANGGKLKQSRLSACSRACQAVQIPFEDDVELGLKLLSSEPRGVQMPYLNED
ncbi:hypothetical protein ACH5RR_023507 [Cinchona calisaya]|uniref:Retrotransposon gag domain-containing protein n=1 Tax=Cinchona calisaya TaxID=153742 RepID=A0ABD2ZAV8_9GENT